MTRRIVKLTSLYLALALALSLGWVQAASAEWVQVIGKAPIEGGDTATAEREALDDALRKAVEQVCGTLIQASTNIENAQVVKDEVLSSARGYITRYNVLSSRPSADGRHYIVTVEADVNTASLKERIRRQEQALLIRQKQMGNKNVIVLGIKQFLEDFPWATKPFELTVQMVKEKLAQAQFIVLDEGAIEGFAGVARTLKQGGWRKPALYQMAKAAHADWMVVVAMDATRQKADPDHAFNQVEVHMRMELIDVNTGQVLTAKYEKARKNLETTNPRYAHWQEAVSDAAREAAEAEITDIVNTLVAHHRGFQPTEPQRYIVRFERFQDQHVDAILKELRRLPGVTQMRVQSQKSRLTVVQVFYRRSVDSLRTGLKRILAGFGYRHPRIEFSGNKLVFRNTTRF
jgi:hypothetical protein